MLPQPVAGTLAMLAYFAAIWWAIFYGEDKPDDDASQADRD
jgi:hypothetical protein